MITVTLDAMAAGGMYDQVGGGFARYSTDDYWLVPHFEKMLYDNALAHARVPARRGSSPASRGTSGSSRRRSTYVLRDLRHAEGGFFSAEDADSEGDRRQVLLVVARGGRGGVRRRRRRGDRVLRRHRRAGTSRIRTRGTGATSSTSSTAPRSRRTRCSGAASALLTRRSRAMRPGLDNKVLLAWNALFLGALAEAARPCSTGTTGWTRRATNAPVPPHASSRRDDGRLLRSWRAPYLAYAEDYAALLEALCTLAELDDASWLDDARPVADDLVRLFADADDGGFFTTGHDAERSSCGRRTCSTTRHRRRTHSPRTGCSGSPR